MGLPAQYNSSSSSSSSSNNKRAMGGNRSKAPAIHHNSKEDIPYKVLGNLNTNTTMLSLRHLRRLLEVHTFHQHREVDLDRYMAQIR